MKFDNAKSHMAGPKDRGGTDCNDDFIKITEVKWRKSLGFKNDTFGGNPKKPLKIKFWCTTRGARGRGVLLLVLNDIKKQLIRWYVPILRQTFNDRPNFLTCSTFFDFTPLSKVSRRGSFYVLSKIWGPGVPPCPLRGTRRKKVRKWIG